MKSYECVQCPILGTTNNFYSESDDEDLRCVRRFFASFLNFSIFFSLARCFLEFLTFESSDRSLESLRKIWNIIKLMLSKRQKRFGKKKKSNNE